MGFDGRVGCECADCLGDSVVQVGRWQQRAWAGAEPDLGQSGRSISASSPPVTCSTATSRVPASAARSDAYVVRAGRKMRVAAPPGATPAGSGASKDVTGHSSSAHRRSWAWLKPPSGVLKRGELRKLGSRTDSETPGVAIILIQREEKWEQDLVVGLWALRLWALARPKRIVSRGAANHPAGRPQLWLLPATW
jgi:hypothetical protein